MGRADTALIQRLHYPEGSKEFDWRFRFWKDNVLPYIKNQTDKNFDHWVWCEKHHEHLFHELGVNTFQVNHKTTFGRNIHDYTEYSNVENLPKYPIQISIDSDDRPSKEIVEKVRSLATGDSPKLISFQPVKVNKGRRYRMKNYQKLNRCSAIFAMYQPSLDNYRWAYYRSHYRMPNDEYWETIHIGEGYADVFIHGHNHSTHIMEGDERI